MESTTRILLVGEVAALLRVANSSVYRWLGQRRRGIGTFPLPISSMGGKLRWLADDIEHYIASQVSPSVNVSTTRQAKRQAKDFRERQERATEALRRHGLNRKTNGSEA
jgi:predicted DNA-binding transcriptional regulator AlpA